MPVDLARFDLIRRGITSLSRFSVCYCGVSGMDGGGVGDVVGVGGVVGVVRAGSEG